MITTGTTTGLDVAPEHLADLELALASFNKLVKEGRADCISG
jgi:hypothetical protein